MENKIEIYKDRMEIQGEWSAIDFLHVSLALSQTVIEILVNTGMTKEKALKSYMISILDTNEIKEQMQEGDISA